MAFRALAVLSALLITAPLSVQQLAVHPAAAQTVPTTTTHALSLIGPPRYPADFSRLDYVDVAAPKGGEIRLSSLGGFDTINPFIAKGDPAPGIGLVYDTLMTSTLDDASAEYGLIAETVEVPEDLSWVAFNIRPEARWHDGTKITADDVVFSFETLKAKGAPLYRFYYADVARAEALSPAKVKFTFSGPRNRELPQIMGQLPVLQKAYWSANDIERTTLTPFMSSGPYKVGAIEANRSVTLERVKDYWARDLALNRGRHNFDRIRYDLYRDETVRFEAFKAGQYDYRAEIVSRLWVRDYDFPAVRNGQVIKLTLANERPGGMVGFGFNQRRPMFKDVRVREALARSFDWEWSNQNLLFDQHQRIESYFPNSEAGAKGLPGPEELALLEPLKAQVPPRVFTEQFKAPVSDGTGADRTNLRQSAALLREAGWTVKDQKLIGPDGQQMKIEVLLQQEAFVGIFNAWKQTLARLGVDMTVRLVDSAQYVNRMRSFDFDMALVSWAQSESPGNEQRDFFSCAAATRENSRNQPGICDPAVDQLIDRIIQAHDRAELLYATRALDRVLLWNWYVVPFSTVNVDRIAVWNKFGMPKTTPRYGPDILAWWIDPAKQAALEAARKQ